MGCEKVSKWASLSLFFCLTLFALSTERESDLMSKTHTDLYLEFKISGSLLLFITQSSQREIFNACAQLCVCCTPWNLLKAVNFASNLCSCHTQQWLCLFILSLSRLAPVSNSSSKDFSNIKFSCMQTLKTLLVYVVSVDGSRAERCKLKVVMLLANEFKTFHITTTLLFLYLHADIHLLLLGDGLFWLKITLKCPPLGLTHEHFRYFFFFLTNLLLQLRINEIFVRWRQKCLFMRTRRERDFLWRSVKKTFNWLMA